MSKRRKKRTSAAAARPRRSVPRRSPRPRDSGRDKKTLAVLTRELDAARQQLNEALEQQTATSEVLQVISGSPDELGPVFNAMLENAVRICEAKFGTLFRFEGDAYRAVALHNAPPKLAASYQEVGLRRPTPGTIFERMVRTKQVCHTADYAAEVVAGNASRLGGARSFVCVPMLKDDKLIGAFAIYRQEVRPFTDKQIDLLKNFANQAVIAIENARLLNELRQRTDDLTESLEQQTATSEVLQIISSSPGELEPVFQAMLERGTRLCEASYGILWLCQGDQFRTGGFYGALPPAYTERWPQGTLVHLDPDVPSVRAIKTRQPVQVADFAQSRAYLDGDPLAVDGVEVAGIRTLVAVPMLRENEAIGSIAIYRTEVRPFSEKQIELVSSFAKQAVIAIENARLLNELRETLEKQTATSKVLSVISSSPSTLEPVFKAMLENATRICEAKFGNLWLRDGDNFRIAATHGAPTEYCDRLVDIATISPGAGTGLAGMLKARQAFQI